MGLTRPRSGQINFDATNITDPLIRINSGQSGANDKDAGWVVERGNDANVALIWDESADEFVLANTTEDGTTSGNVTISSYAGMHVGSFIANGLTYPTSDGTNGQVLQTNGQGTLSFADEGGSSTIADGAVTSAKLDTNIAITGDLTVDTNTFYVDSTNNRVGIGTTSPNYLTELSGNGSGDTVTLALTNAGSHPARVRFNSGHGNWSVGNSISVADALEFRDESASATRMMIDSVGKLLLGATGSTEPCRLFATSATSATGPALVLQNTDGGATSGNIVVFYRESSGVGTISTTNSATAYNTSSDYRLKENVVAVTDGITRLQQLKPSRFNFIVDPDKTVDGFLAHEAQAVVPECVTGTKDAMRLEEYEITPAVINDEGVETTAAVMGTREVPEYQGIDQSKLVPLLTSALQEAIAKIESLEARVSALEAN